MQNDYTLSNEKTVERATDARPAPGSEFEQSVAKSARVRQTKTWPMLGQQFDQARIVSKHINGPHFDLSKHAFMEVFDLKRHAYMLANM